MNFKWKNGLIWIPFSITYEGTTHALDNCILDTGSASTAIDIDLVDFNYNKPAAIKRLHGIGGGIQEVVSHNVEKLKIEKTEFTNIEIEFGDLQSDFGINGIIGNDVLQHFVLTIDYSKQEIIFKPLSVF